MLFLAQSDPSSMNVNWTWPVIAILIASGLLLAFGLFFGLLFRNLRASRQLLHAERMRSLEAGFPLYPPESPEDTKVHSKFLHNAFWISFWLVFGVPSAALSAASAATKTDASLALSIVIWVAAAVVCVAAVVCAAVLMIYSHRSASNGEGLQKIIKL